MGFDLRLSNAFTKICCLHNQCFGKALGRHAGALDSGSSPAHFSVRKLPYSRTPTSFLLSTGTTSGCYAYLLQSLWEKLCIRSSTQHGSQSIKLERGKSLPPKTKSILSTVANIAIMQGLDCTQQWRRTVCFGPHWKRKKLSLRYPFWVPYGEDWRFSSQCLGLS